MSSIVVPRCVIDVSLSPVSVTPVTYSEDEPFRLTPYRLNKPQAANFLAISIKTLERRVAAGDIPAYREGERSVVFKRSDLEAYADKTPAWEPRTSR